MSPVTNRAGQSEATVVYDSFSGADYDLAAYLSKNEVGRALAHRIRHGPEALETPEVFGELDDLRNRVLELEERLDFAERLLAQPKEPERAAGRLGGEA